MDGESDKPSAAAAETIFSAALELPPAQRPAYLATACGDNQKLRQRVEALLRADEAPESFLPEQPGPGAAVAPTAADLLAAQLTERPGDLIGRYKLLEKLGEGGCGVVYMAEQEEPVRRKVALKVIKLGMDTRSVIARFEAERQALALMDHANIAKVLDAGATDTGRPYFVMELVGGIKITDYCEQNNLTTGQRLDLFIQVCHAIQHAHQKGVIHRDIKPSNVLVATQDGVAVPKVIDFGIAKATQGRLTDDTVFTAFEQFLGTPAYMSPEQAQPAGFDVDTRSDIYSLGVLLYELLTGKTPFDAKELLAAGLEAMRRTIQEKEPPTPSTRLKQDTAARAAASDKSALRSPHSALDRDLDWIVMKCLEKDRARRYETANGLARDIERHLDNEPVMASPPSQLYRFQKLVRRNRVVATATGVIGIVLVLGVVASTWHAIRAKRAEQKARSAQLNEAREREKATSQKRIAEAVLNFLQEDLLRQADPKAQADLMRQRGQSLEVREDLTIKQLLDRAAMELVPDKIEVKFPSQPAVQASILTTMGVTYRGIGETAKAEELLSRASDLCRSAFGAQHIETLRTCYRLALTYSDAGKWPQAIALFEQVRDAQMATLGAEHLDTLNTLTSLAAVHHVSGKLAESIEILERVGDIQVRTLGADHKWTLYTKSELASCYQGAGKFERAVALFEQVRDAELKTLGPDHPSTLGTMTQLAQVYLYLRRVPQAIELLERVRTTRAKQLAADHPSLLRTMNNLGEAYADAYRLSDAIALFEQVREARVRKLGADHPDTLITMYNLASAYREIGKFPEAIELLEQVRDGQTKKLGPEHPDLLATLHGLAFAYRQVGNQPKAIELLEQICDATQKVQGPDHPNSIAALYSLAQTYRAVGRTEQALPLLRRAGEGIEKGGFRDRNADRIIGGLVGCLKQCKQDEEALSWERKWPAIVRQREGAESPAYAASLADVGLILIERQKWSEAETLLRESLALREKLFPDDWTTFNTRSILGHTLLGQRKFSDAQPLLLSAQEGLSRQLATIPPTERVCLNEAVARLVELYEYSDKQEEASKWRDEARRRPVRRNDEGAIRQWLILGPIPLAPDQRRPDSIRAEQLVGEGQLRPMAGDHVSVGGQELVWQPQHLQDYAANFNTVVGVGKNTLYSIAYAVCYLRVPEPRTDLTLNVGSDDEARVYLNGRLIYEVSKGRSLRLDEDTVSGVELNAGLNVLVFKVMNEQGTWGGALRFANADDTAVQGLKVVLDPTERSDP